MTLKAWCGCLNLDGLTTRCNYHEGYFDGIDAVQKGEWQDVPFANSNSYSENLRVADQDF